MFPWLAWCIVATAIASTSASAEAGGDVGADWRMLRQFVHEDVRVIQESDREIVFVHPATTDTLVVGASPPERVGECDLYRHVSGDAGNARRVWVIDEARWHDASLARSRWADFFRTSFLKIVRPPVVGDGTAATARAQAGAS